MQAKIPTILYVQNSPSTPVLGSIGNDMGKFYPCCSRPFHNGKGDTVPYILVTEHKEMARLATAAVLEGEAELIADPLAKAQLVAKANAIRAKKVILKSVEKDAEIPG
jgi:hypothetical protein